MLVQDVGNKATLPRSGELRPPLDVVLLLCRHPREDRVQVGVVLAGLCHPGVHLARRAVELHAEPEYLAHATSFEPLQRLAWTIPQAADARGSARTEKWTPGVT